MARSVVGMEGMNSRIVLLAASADDDLRGLLPEGLSGARLLRGVATECFPEFRVEQGGGREALTDAALVAAIWPLAGNAEELLREAGEKDVPRLVVVERALEFVDIRTLPADKVACIGRAQARTLRVAG